MPKLVLHLFHADPGSLNTVPMLAERLHRSAADSTGAALEVFIFGPAEQALAAADRAEFNARIDALVKLGVRVTACIGLAQQAGAETAFRERGFGLESAVMAFPRFAAEGATVISF